MEEKLQQSDRLESKCNQSIISSRQSILPNDSPNRIESTTIFQNKFSQNNTATNTVAQQPFQFKPSQKQNSSILSNIEAKSCNESIKKLKKPVSEYYQKIVSSEVSEFRKKKFLLALYKGVTYCVKSLKSPSNELVNLSSILLKEPKQSKPKFLMLDLDETLIYTERGQGSHLHEAVFEVSFRPHVFDFLSVMADYYEIYVFTAAGRKYAEAAVEKLNSRKRVIRDFLCRENCFETKKGRFIKDLRIIRNRQLKDIVILDNLVSSFGLQLENGIPILEYIGSGDDNELLLLKNLLIELSSVYDVRPILKDRLKLRQLSSIPKEDIIKYARNGVFDKQQLCS